MNVKEIMELYTKGEKSVDETNAELKKVKAGFYLDPKKHWFSPDEIIKGTAGLLDTGTGTMDKVVVNPEKMELAHAVNEVNADGTTNMYAMCIVKGKTYEVKGRKLVAVQ